MNYKIKMKKTTSGSVNGSKVSKFLKDEIYTIPEELANVFVYTMKVAVFQKMEEIVPDNKMMEPPIENKTEYPVKNKKKFNRKNK